MNRETAFSILGLDSEATIAQIEREWSTQLAWWRPGRDVMPQYREVMAAGRELLEFDAADDADFAPILVALVLADAQELRDEPEVTPGQMATVADRLKALPKTISHSRLASVPGCAAAIELIRELLPLEEFARVRGLTGPEEFDVAWKTRVVKSKLAIVHGSLQAIPQERRDMWPTSPVPSYQLRLSLPYWVLCDDAERERLIHHELCHGLVESGTAKLRPHDIEENLETAMRYGARDIQHARLMEAALRHPRTRAMLATDPDGQMNLPFEDGGLEPRGNVVLLAGRG